MHRVREIDFTTENTMQALRSQRKSLSTLWILCDLCGFSFFTDRPSISMVHDLLTMQNFQETLCK